MQTKILFCADEIAAFVHEYNRLTGDACYQPSQFSNIKVRAFFDSNQRMITGYVINNQRPYKALPYAPDDIVVNGIFIK